MAVTLRHYHSRTEAQFKRELRFRKLTKDFLPRCNWSQIDVALRYFQEQKFVDYCGGLAGRNCGFYDENGIKILVTKEPRIIIPPRVSGRFSTNSSPICLAARMNPTEMSNSTSFTDGFALPTER